MTANISQFFVDPESSIREVMTRIDRNAKGIALVVDKQQRLLGTITDGDLRRALLQSENMDRPVSHLLTKKNDSRYRSAVTAPNGKDHASLLALMQQQVVRQLPLVDERDRVVDLVTLDELMPERVLPLEAVIMAGGEGKRLGPLTKELPKPMLPIDGRPVMEFIIGQLREAGIRKVSVTTHYKPEKIMEHFGDGRVFGIDLEYVTEAHPLGTAGALGLMEKPKEPVLVINGDVLTRLDFRAMLSFHQEHKADLTVAVRKYDVDVPYGIVETNGTSIQNLVEKPLLTFFVNAGIYLLGPSVYDLIPQTGRCDMTDLIRLLIQKGRAVAPFPVLEYWLDIGQTEDYKQAQEDMQNGRL